MYKLRWSKQALKDKDDVERAGLMPKLSKILGVMERDPFEPTPGHRFEKLKGYLEGMYSRRINYRNRIVYSVLPNAENLKHPQTGELYKGIVPIYESWGHNYKK